MHLSRIEIGDFRNIEGASLALNPRFNYIYGANGAGKTALLEAVCILSRGRSFRSTSPAPLIRQGADRLTVRGDCVASAGHTQSVGIGRDRQGDTQIRIDGETFKRTSELARLIPAQVVLPDAAELVFGAPGNRRSFLDWGLFHVKPQYLALSRKYRRILQQRNVWLKTAEEVSDVEQDPWYTQMCESGLEMGVAQSNYLVRLIPHFEKLLRLLMPDLELRLEYGWGGLESPEMAAKKWSESFARDVKLGVTNRGPHRADVLIWQGGLQASELLSRGQAKAAASALILAQTLMQIEETQQSCVLLIDDFGAELDKAHWLSFLDVLRDLECQVIATSTVHPGENDVWMDTLDCDVFHVEHGAFQKVHTSTID